MIKSKLTNNGTLGYIVNEEIRKFLVESKTIGGPDFKFKQQVPQLSFSNYHTFSNDYDVEVSQGNINITWQVSFDVNDVPTQDNPVAGIQKFKVDVESVEGMYRIEMYNKQTDKLEQQTDKNINDHDWVFELNDNLVKLFVNGALYVKGLHFDFEKNNCKVTF